MLLRKLIFFVTKTHLMVKRDLLQQIIYFVVLIQTFFVTQNNYLTLCYWETYIFCHQNSFNGENELITTYYIFCGKAWPFDPNPFLWLKTIARLYVTGKIDIFCHPNSFNGEKWVITTTYIFCSKVWPFDPNLSCGSKPVF